MAGSVGLAEENIREGRAGSWLNGFMDIKNLAAVPAFITKDGSEIRELLAHRNSGIRNQSLAEARLPVGGAHAGALSSPMRGNLLHHAGQGTDAH